MKTAKVFAVLIVLLICSRHSFSQNTASATAEAEYLQGKAGIFQDSMQYDSADVYFTKASNLYQENLQWRDFLQCETNRAKSCHDQKLYDQAVNILKPALRKSLVHMGEMDTIVADSYFWIGLQYHSLSETDSAIHYWDKSLQLNVELRGGNSASVAQAYNNIGSVYLNRGEYEHALSYLLKALEVKEELLGGKNLEVAKACGYIGGIYKIKSDYDLALKYLSRSLAIRREILGEQHIEVSKDKLKMGILFYHKDEYDMAIQYYSEALETTIKLLGEKNWRVADVYNNLALVYAARNEYDAALNYHFSSLKIKQDLYGENHASVASSYTNIGILYDAINEYDLALEYHSKSLGINTALLGPEHLSVSRNYQNIGNVYLDKDEYDLALDYYNQALDLKLAQLGGKHAEVAGAIVNIGIIHKTRSRYTLALECYFDALEIFLELLGENHSHVANSYTRIGDIYEIMDDYDQALEHYFKALHINKALLGETHTLVAICYDNIGRVYLVKAEYDLALEYFYKALQIYQELLGEDHAFVAQIYSRIGDFYRLKKEFEPALDFYLKALEIFSKIYGETHNDVASCKKKIGLIYMRQEQFDLALEYHSEALKTNLELLGEDHNNVANAYANLSLTYKKNEQKDLSLEYAFKSLEIYKGNLGENNARVAYCYNAIGSIFEDQGDYEKALSYYQKGIASNLSGFTDTCDAYSLPVLKEYWLWNRLLSSIKSKAEVLRRHIKDHHLALLHYELCDSLISQVRKEMRTEADKIALGELANEVYSGAVKCCLELVQTPGCDSISYFKERAFYFSEKNKSSVLLEAIAGVEAQKFAGIPDSLLAKEHALKIDIALHKKLLAENPDSTNEIFFREKLFIANRQYDELISGFEAEYPAYFDLKYNTDPADISDIQDILDEKTALISYFTSDSALTIFTLTKEDIHIVEKPFDEDHAETLQDMRHSLQFPGNPMFAKDYKRDAHFLYSKLIPDQHLGKMENLIIIPDADLSQVPFEALLSNDPEDLEWEDLPYLVKLYNVSYSYSATLFSKTVPTQTVPGIEFSELNDWIALAPVFDNANSAGLTLQSRELLQQIDGQFTDSSETRGRLLDGRYISPLPGTEIEVKEIFNEFDKNGKKALIQLKQNANEEYIKEGGLKNYRYLHFATHGFINTSKPELSGILMAQDSSSMEDGILYSGEIYNLTLNSELTILSACETGLGEMKKGEGLIGLTRALLYAGSKNIIVSLWKVSDHSTSSLMIDFYKSLLAGKADNPEISKALQTAKLKMITEGAYAHPYFWSAFILIGK